MKKLFVIFICAFAFFIFTSCKKKDSTKVLYLGHSLPQAHPVHKGILEFKKVLEEKGGLRLINGDGDNIRPLNIRVCLKFAFMPGVRSFF